MSIVGQVHKLIVVLVRPVRSNRCHLRSRGERKGTCRALSPLPSCLNVSADLGVYMSLPVMCPGIPLAEQQPMTIQS